MTVEYILGIHLEECKRVYSNLKSRKDQRLHLESHTQSFSSRQKKAREDENSGITQLITKTHMLTIFQQACQT